MHYDDDVTIIKEYSNFEFSKTILVVPSVIHERQDDVLIVYMNLYKPLIGASFWS